MCYLVQARHDLTMAAFDQSWWDDRTMHFGTFDTSGLPPQSGGTIATWMRWRLIDDLLRRYYCDIGLEPAFGLMGTELYQVALISPTCRRAPRYFGRLCGVGLHPGDDSDLISPLDGLPLAWAGLAEVTDEDHEGLWATWSEYRHHAIQSLGLAGAGIPKHQHCFHRRGKALTPLMFRVALLLRTNGGYDDYIPFNAMLTVAGWTNEDNREQVHQIIDVIKRAGGSVPPGPPRYLAVQSEVYGWVALGTDGWVATPAGPIDAAGLWRRGANEEEIAGAIHHMSIA